MMKDNDEVINLMQKHLSNFSEAMDKIRTGRINTKIISSIKICHSGKDLLLEHISTINVINFNTVIVTPYDKNLLNEIDKEIRNKGLNTIIARDSIKVIFSCLSLDDKKKLIKYIFSEAELFKIAIRNVRKDKKNDLSLMLKNKTITLDEEKSIMKLIQKSTDKFIDDIDKIVKNKEKEILDK